MLDIKVPLCGKLNLHGKTVSYKYDDDCLKFFDLHFTALPVIQISGNSPILEPNTKKPIKKTPRTAVEIFTISIFYLKQACKIVPTENCLM